MRCSSCDRLIPDDSKICQYCGETFTVNHNTRINQVSFTEISRKHFWDKVLNGVSPFIGLAIVLALILGAFGVASLFDLFQSRKAPVEFSQDVYNGDPVWSVVVSVEEPRYVVVTTYNSRSVGGFATPGEDSDVFCKCLDKGGNTVWLLLKYKEYIECFSGRDLSTGLKIFGRVRDSDDVVDQHYGEIEGQKVFDFKSVDE